MASRLWQGFKSALGIHSPSYIEEALMQIRSTAAETVASLSRAAVAMQTEVAATMSVPPAVESVAAQPSATSSPAAVTGASQVVLQVGVLVADDAGLRKLARLLDEIRASERFRVAGVTT